MASSRPRTAIGRDPLELLIPSSQDHGSGRSAAHPADRKVRATFHISASLLEELRDAVVALSGPPARLTLAGLAEQALARELTELKRCYNEGQAFPVRSGELRPGRPIT